MKTTNHVNTVPSHTTRAGKIRAAVWEQHSATGITHKIMVNRLFRQGDQWRRGRTFFASELPAIVEAVSAAQRWIDQRHRQLRSEQQPTQMTG